MRWRVISISSEDYERLLELRQRMEREQKKRVSFAEVVKFLLDFYEGQGEDEGVAKAATLA